MKFMLRAKWSLAIVAFCSIMATLTVPAQAQTVTHWVDRQLKVDDHYHPRRGRHHASGNSWQSLSYVGAGVAVVGILTHEPVLVGLGIAGGLYSTYRFEQDRNSHNARDHRRFVYFSQAHRTINGRRYHRVIVRSNGHRYYAYRRD